MACVTFATGRLELRNTLVNGRQSSLDGIDDVAAAIARRAEQIQGLEHDAALGWIRHVHRLEAILLQCLREIEGVLRL